MDIVDINILELDRRIKAYFAEELQNKAGYTLRLKQLNTIFNYPNLRNGIKHSIIMDIKYLKNKLNTINNMYFYEMDTYTILTQYQDILNTKVDLTINNVDSKNHNYNKMLGHKVKLNAQFFAKVKMYLTSDIMSRLKLTKTFRKRDLLQNINNIFCENCGNSDIFDKSDENIFTCLRCSNEVVKLINSSSYNDNGRVNVSNKYTYDRKVHFKDCMNQYQAKQNTNISPNVYHDIERELLKHRLIQEPNTSIDRKTRFAMVTRNHIQFFLRELGHTKHYEDVILIHYTLTGQQPDNIEHLEDRLSMDFDLLTEAYDRLFKHIERKNFINTQYVLFQLLRRYKYPCSKDDFAVLKTIERKASHDEICKTLFDALGWEYEFIM